MEDRGLSLGLTLNDIQNSLQLILFRMHKYKQMGMPVAVAFPALFRGDPPPFFRFYSCLPAVGEACGGCWLLSYQR